jgi:predicted nucleotidyltransferase
MVGAAELRALTAAEELARLLTDVVGAGVRSVMLHGSLSAGGFRPERSDIDLLAVVDGSLADEQAAVVERLVRRADFGGAAGIELDVVTAEVAGAPNRAPALEMHLSRYDRLPDDIEVQRRVTGAPDLLVELSMARAQGRALVGTAPHEVIAPVPADWIVERGRYWLMTWRSRTDDVRHAAFMVLTACRIWRFAVERVHCPKAEAARRALDRDASLMVVRQALRQYEHDPAGVVDEQGIAVLLDAVLQDTARMR